MLSPIITRLYSPNDFGVLAAFASVLTILTVVACLRFELAIPVAPKDEEASGLVYLSLACVGGWLIALFGMLAFVGSRLDRLKDLHQLIWLVPVAVGAAGVFRTVEAWTVRKAAYGRLGLNRLYQTSSSLTCQIAAGGLGMGPLGLVGGLITGYVTGACVLARHALAQRPPSARALMQLARVYRRFPLFTTWASLLKAGGMQTPILLILGSFGSHVAGLLGLAQKIVATPMNLIGEAVARVFLGDAARQFHQDPASLRTFFWKTAKLQALIGAITIVPLALCAPPLFSFLFGKEWYDAGRYVQMLAPMFFCQFVSNPLEPSVDILQRQELYALREFLRFSLMVGPLWYFIVHHSVKAEQAIKVLSLSGTVTALAGFAISWIAIMTRQADPT
ncbi:MAG: lipopolysaccharide biosynthesis protein [Vulcanimicrobiota bacterium]